MDKISTKKLVQKAKKGDGQAFVHLCQKYETVLYNAAYKMLLNEVDVADCLQETELCAWEKITTLKNEHAFNSWIFKIMLNQVQNIFREKQKTTLLFLLLMIYMIWIKDYINYLIIIAFR